MNNTSDTKLKEIKKYILKIQKEVNNCSNKDWEYNTSDGNGVNASECSHFFKPVVNEILTIIKTKKQHE